MDSVEQIVAEMRAIAANIARAGINGFGNQITDAADRLEDAMKRRAEMEASNATLIEMLQATHEEMAGYRDKIRAGGRYMPPPAQAGGWVRVVGSAIAHLKKQADGWMANGMIAPTPPAQAQEAAPINVNPIDSKSIGAGGGCDE